MAEQASSFHYEQQSVEHDRRLSSSESCLTQVDADNVYDAQPLTNPSPPKSPIAHVRPVHSYVAVATHDKRIDSPKSRLSICKFQSIWDRLGSWWIWELICLVVGAACLTATAAICLYIDGKPLDHWHSSISPNAMISTLATISKASLLFAVAASLSQLKWLYFQGRPHPLADLDIYNAATSSPVGALHLLLQIRSEAFLTSAAALIVVAALLFEPMAQQLLSYKQAPVQDFTHEASIPIAQAYDTAGSVTELDTGGSLEGLSADDKMRLAIFDGFMASSSGSTPGSMQLPLSCPSGNCSYDPFTTLAICSECRSAGPDADGHFNATHWITNEDCVNKGNAGEMGVANQESCSYTSDSGLTVSIVRGYLQTSIPVMVTVNVAGGFPHAPDESLRTIDYPVFSASLPETIFRRFLIARADSNSMRLTPSEIVPTAPFIDPIKLRDLTECSLAWCAQTFERITVVSSSFTLQQPARKLPLRFDPTSKGNSVIRLSIPSDVDAQEVANKTFLLSQEATDDLTALVNRTLNVSRIQPEDMYGAFNITANPLDVSKNLDEAQNITAMIENVATSMSNAVRLLAKPNVRSINTSIPVSSPGQVWVMTTIVKISWGWITLPALVVLASAFVLVGSILASSSRQATSDDQGVPLWKASNIGILSHGYDWADMAEQDARKATGRKIGSADSRQQVKEWARNTQIQLTRDGEGHMRFRIVDDDEFEAK